MGQRVKRPGIDLAAFVDNALSDIAASERAGLRHDGARGTPCSPLCLACSFEAGRREERQAMRNERLRSGGKS
jgi:hypothetical protein